jgi:iron complex transport system substrate-binding protein
MTGCRVPLDASAKLVREAPGRVCFRDTGCFREGRPSRSPAVIRIVRSVVVGLATLVGFAFPEPSTAATFVDDAGRPFRLDRPAQRVITLAPNLTELVYAVGAGSTLVGTGTLSNFPKEAKAVPRVGDHQRFDVERILLLKPDLVLAWYHGNPGRELAQLEAAGLPLYYLEPRRLDDVARALERVGDLLGRGAEGRARANAWRADIAQLREAHRGAEPVSVFYQVWRNPLMTLNGEHIVSDVIALCGGRNVFADLPQLVPQLSTESVVAANPQAMLSAREDAEDQPVLKRGADDAAFVSWSSYRSIEAVRRNWLYTLPGDLIARQGPRIADGARAVCAALDQVRAERRHRP